MMHRRTFTFAIAGGLATMPLVSLAQVQGKVWRIGMLGLYTVPAGKRLVVEYVGAVLRDVGAVTNTGKFYFELEISDSLGHTTLHPIGTSSDSAPCDAATACLFVARQVRIYANPGDFVQVFGSYVLTSSSGVTGLVASMNGYLVDLP